MNMASHSQAAQQEQARHTPKVKTVSKMKENNIKSHTLFSHPIHGDNRSNAVWERIVFSQNYKAKRVSSAQLKLDTDLVLSDVLFNDLLTCMKSLQPKDPSIKDDPNEYISENFQNIFYNIRPGKHYIEWVIYLAKLNAGELNANPKYEKFTCTCSFFEKSTELSFIDKELKIVNINHPEFIFEHKDERIGLSYNPNDKSINLEIKFFDRKTSHESPSFKIGNRREPPHPKKEIVINLHLRNENYVNLWTGKPSINTVGDFSKSILERIKEFFTYFYKCKEWLDDLKESSLPPLGKPLTECGYYSKQLGALFYLQPSSRRRKKTPDSSPESNPLEDLEGMKDLFVTYPRSESEASSFFSLSPSHSDPSLLSSSPIFPLQPEDLAHKKRLLDKAKQLVMAIYDDLYSYIDEEYQQALEKLEELENKTIPELEKYIKDLYRVCGYTDRTASELVAKLSMPPAAPPLSVSDAIELLNSLSLQGKTTNTALSSSSSSSQPQPISSSSSVLSPTQLVILHSPIIHPSPNQSLPPSSSDLSAETSTNSNRNRPNQ